ncbi:HAD hydrolase family protein [Bacillus cereus]|uniref:HAD hydrolase family protein n=1 Tax=Bacillus cereus TaxID=1396 RepID=UPI0035CA6F1F
MTDEDLSSIKYLNKIGVPIIFATGRTHTNAQIIAEKIGLNNPIISSYGVMIRSSTSKNDLIYKKYNDETRFRSTKTFKLSFALNSINKIPKKIYIGVYEFDARPHKNTVNWIANDNCYRKGVMPTVYQQIPYVIQNVNTKTPKVIDLLSIWHIRRSLRIEGYNFFSKKSKKDIFYLMGSGIYI